MEPTQPKPIATWSPTLDVWLASDDETEGLFSVPSAVFSETFPTSGTWADGTAYELPTSEPRTDDSECSSLPTPRATRGGSHTETVALLPTPMVGSTSPAAHGQISGQYRTAMAEALPQHFSPLPDAPTG